MHNSDFDKNFDFFRELAQEFTLALGQFLKFPSGSGKFLGKFPRKIKSLGTNFGPLRG